MLFKLIITQLIFDCEHAFFILRQRGLNFYYTADSTNDITTTLISLIVGKCRKYYLLKMF